MPRPSVHREPVAEALAAAPGPLSAAEVELALGASGIGIATVYRLLNAGTERGEFKAVEMPHGATRYEPADRPHHHHFACTGCDAVYDVPGCPGDLERMAPAGFAVHDHEILLSGLCAGCSTGEAA